ncbi:MAG: aromatic ring-hydroxylating dioxygenase subunit alpha [Dehalococcoidia bacterium]|nr:aromatic ring-hydroxylating dioxygenase subunit alpha [Dehalococcoidia bacterium]
MAYGVVEEDGLRCQYHGWKFDHTGACTEQPFEETVHPDGRFKEKCAVTGYQVQELAGLIFAYMGPLPAPLLPMWEPLSWDNTVLDIAISELPCNWLQCQENSLDPVHVEWMHAYYSEFIKEVGTMGEPKLGAALNIDRAKKHKRIGFDVFEHGIIKRRVVEGFSEEDHGWKIGHPILFPHVLMVGNTYQVTFQWRVPVDDQNTFHVSLYLLRTAPGAEKVRQDTVPYRYVHLYDEQGRWVLDYIFNQDYMAWASQGPIAERHREKMGESDKGIILYRNLLKQQLKILAEGGVPMNVIRDAEYNRCIKLPLEDFVFGVAKRPERYEPMEEGYSADTAAINAAAETWDAIAAFSRRK